MTVIQIKRSTGATAPTTNDLAEGELAYSEDRSGNGASAVLYIESVASDGTTAVIDKVGGKYYTNTVDDFLTPDTTTVGAKVTLYEGSTNGTNYVQLKAPDSIASNLSLTLPGADGSNGHILTTNGAGVLSFQAPSSSSLTLAGDTGTDTFSTGQTLTFTGGTGLDSAVTDNTVTFNIDSTVTTNSGTQTLTNKSLSDSTTFFIDETDGTKKMQFQLSGITTATTRTVTVPDADLTLVGTATTQTLTNKTLTSPTLTTPVLGTPQSGTLTNCTGLPISTGVSGLGTGVATFLATPSSANLVAAMTDETGSGALYFVGGALGTPSSATLTNATGLPVSGITSSTSAALGLGSIELGHATDTTISRVSAGVVAIEGVNVVTTSSTDTLTNKTLTAPKIANAGFIADANGNEQLIFTTTASAVNEITVANAATGNAPSLTASGETNVSLNLRAKGTGTVNVGSTGLSVSGSTSGTTTLVSAATASGSLTLPSATDTLVGRATTDTLTNKTINGSSNTITNVSLTSGVTGTLPVANGGTGITSFGTGVATFLGTPSSANLAAAVTDETGTGALVFANTPTLTTPVIAEIDATADLTLDAAGDIVLDADGADVILKDAGVTFGALTNSGGELVIKSGSSSTTAITMSGANVTVSGNLTVNGTSTIVNSTTVSVDDALLKLGADNAANSVDTGFYTEYIASTVQKWAGLFKDASDGDKWKLFKDLQAEPTTTVNTSGTGYTIGTLVANLEGGTVSGLTTDIAVADGGTGASTFTTNGVLYGAGTGAIQATAAGTNGYILYSNSGTPAWTNVIDGGTY